MGSKMEQNLKNLPVTVNTQSSIRIGGSCVLYFDPFQIGEEKHDADLILITHSHYDHFDPDSIRRICKAETVFVAPCSMEKEMLGTAAPGQLLLMNPGESRQAGDVLIEAVPAYNVGKPFHPKSNQWNGYVATLDGIRYYVAGDTDAVDALSSVSCDVALLPIGGKYTMTAKEAAELTNKIRPQMVIPTHYGSIVGKPGDAKVFAEHVQPGIVVEIKL